MRLNQEGVLHNRKGGGGAEQTNRIPVICQSNENRHGAILIDLLFIFTVQERDFMKNLMTLFAGVAFLTMAFSAGTMAQCGRMGGGPMQFSATAPIAPETLAKFNKETKGLQEQLIDKQAALKKEFLKEDPDPDEIAKLQKDIIDIQTGIQKVAKKLGMKNCNQSCGMFMGNGGCCGMRGCGMR